MAANVTYKKLSEGEVGKVSVGQMKTDGSYSLVSQVMSLFLLYAMGHGLMLF